MKHVLIIPLMLCMVSCTHLSAQHDSQMVPACPRDSQSRVDPSRAWVHVVPIKHRHPSEVAEFLNAMIQFAEHHPESRMNIGASRAIPDDRTCVLVILTAPSNMSLFENFVEALDVSPTE